MKVPVLKSCEPVEVDRLGAPKKEATRDKPSLVLGSGPLSGTRYLLEAETTLVGRNPENDIVVTGPECAVVSGHHLEIRRDGECFLLRDHDSTNGTFVEGKRENRNRAPGSLRDSARSRGPATAFRNGRASAGGPGPQPDCDARNVCRGCGQPAEQILRHAVTRARLARRSGIADQTGASWPRPYTWSVGRGGG